MNRKRIKTMSNEDKLKMLMSTFSYGVSQGLLYANEEKENRIDFEAMLGVAYDNKNSMPLPLGKIEEPQPKSKQWINGHKKEIEKFYKLLSETFSNPTKIQQSEETKTFIGELLNNK